MTRSRRSEFDREDSDRARARLQVLDALVEALDRRDDFFRVVAAAADADGAVDALMTEFDVDRIGATAMLELQARRFTKDERARIAQERESLVAEL